eukprot:2975796-Amphidinium_carterae.1
MLRNIVQMLHLLAGVPCLLFLDKSCCMCAMGFRHSSYPSLHAQRLETLAVFRLLFAHFTQACRGLKKDGDGEMAVDDMGRPSLEDDMLPHIRSIKHMHMIGRSCLS